MGAPKMRLPPALRGLAVLPVLVLAACAAGAGGMDARVARVIDGDTVALASGGVVRYIGIDAPEVRRREGGAWVRDPEPVGLAALEANRRLVEGRRVRLRFDRERRDRYGRLLAYVFMGDLFINEHLVRQGLARARRYPPNLRHAARLEAAEAEARAAGRGLWADKEPP